MVGFQAAPDDQTENIKSSISKRRKQKFEAAARELDINGIEEEKPKTSQELEDIMINHIN